MKVLGLKTCVSVQGLECGRIPASAISEEQPRGEAAAATATAKVAAATKTAAAAASSAAATSPAFDKEPGKRGHAFVCLRDNSQHWCERRHNSLWCLFEGTLERHMTHFPSQHCDALPPLPPLFTSAANST